MTKRGGRSFLLQKQISKRASKLLKKKKKVKKLEELIENERT